MSRRYFGPRAICGAERLPIDVTRRFHSESLRTTDFWVGKSPWLRDESHVCKCGKRGAPVAAFKTTSKSLAVGSCGIPPFKKRRVGHPSYDFRRQTADPSLRSMTNPKRGGRIESITRAPPRRRASPPLWFAARLVRCALLPETLLRIARAGGRCHFPASLGKNGRRLRCQTWRRTSSR